MKEKTWHIKVGSLEKGPFTAQELKGMLHRGEIDPDTLVNLNSGFRSFIFRHLSRHLAPFLCSSIAFGYRIAKNGTICHLICSESKQSKPRVQVSQGAECSRLDTR